MNQSQSLGEVFVEVQHAGHGSGDLGDLDGVGEPVAEVVGERRRKNLGLVLEAAEGARMDNPVMVSLKAVTVGMIRLRKTPATALPGGESKHVEAGLPVPRRYFASASSV